MVYIVSHEVIEGMSVYLEALYNAPVDTILTFPTSISHSLHQALNAAKILRHPRYRKLRQEWTIKKGELTFCIPKSMKLPELEKPFPKFSEVVNTELLNKKVV
jgi:hypothetical protein